MAIKCGHCKGRHVTVQDVRECANGYSPSQRPAGGVRKNQPLKQTSPLPDVSAGRYAIELDGKLGFYKVDRPTEGRWAGYTFVKQYASDEKHDVRGMRAARVLNRIVEAGFEEAMKRYGQEIGSCGHCGRTLTDADSRARGIGPVCLGKMGW